MIDDENEFGLLRGARRIAKAIGESERRTFYLLERGILPATREGNRWVTSKDRLRRFYNGDVARPSPHRKASAAQAEDDGRPNDAV